MVEREEACACFLVYLFFAIMFTRRRYHSRLMNAETLLFSARNTLELSSTGGSSKGGGSIAGGCSKGLSSSPLFFQFCFFVKS